jgi:hypothetical protein
MTQHTFIRSSLRRVAVASFSIAALSLLGGGTAFAKGGSGSGSGGGGGGTTTSSIGVIQRASAVATCDATTTMSLSVDKGANKQVEMAVTHAGMAAGKYQVFKLVDDATGLSVNSFGSFPSTSGSGVFTNLGRTVAPGTLELSFTFQLREGTFDGPVLETCTAHLSTTAQ